MKNYQYYVILGTAWIAPYAPNWVNIAGAFIFGGMAIYFMNRDS